MKIELRQEYPSEDNFGESITLYADSRELECVIEVARKNNLFVIICPDESPFAE